MAELLARSFRIVPLPTIHHQLTNTSKWFTLKLLIQSYSLKSIIGEDYQLESDNLLKILRDDIVPSTPLAKLSDIGTICRDGSPAHFDDVLSILQALFMNERYFMKNVITIVKIILINGATTAAPKRLFSMARTISTRLHSTMKQQRLTH